MNISSAHSHPWAGALSIRPEVAQKAEQEPIQQADDPVSTDTTTPVADARPVEKGSESSANKNEADSQSAGDTPPSPKSKQDLSREELAKLTKMQSRDREVRTHEQAHIAAGGGVVRGGATYKYDTGPDGKEYAISGEVPIDASEAATPEKTLTKAKTVRKAALAPAKPSAQDRAVAAQASQMEQKARQEIREESIRLSQDATAMERNQAGLPPAYQNSPGMGGQNQSETPFHTII